LIKVIELFAGTGSQTQALKNIGVEHEVVAIAEFDKHADKSYRALHGEVNNLFDIRNVEALPVADLWTYSFPCQDISVAGVQRGFNKDKSTRSGLLWEVERLLLRARADGTLPKYLLLENVKNVIGERHIHAYERWLAFLAGFGYQTFTKVLNATGFGVPQSRERVFGISILSNFQRYEFPTSSPTELKLKDILETEVDQGYWITEERVQKMLASNFMQTRKKIRNHDSYANTLCASDGSDPQCVRFPDGNTRKLTETEYWRLMGWTDEQIAKVKAACVPKSQMYKQAGNGIVVNCLEAIFKNLFISE
jgi:DNA (cytosine-5)-methyltransferase 1